MSRFCMLKKPQVFEIYIYGMVHVGVYWVVLRLLAVQGCNARFDMRVQFGDLLGSGANERLGLLRAGDVAACIRPSSQVRRRIRPRG